MRVLIKKFINPSKIGTKNFLKVPPSSKTGYQPTFYTNRNKYQIAFLIKKAVFTLNSGQHAAIKKS